MSTVIFAALLNLAPNSPDAKVFEDFANSSKGSNSTTPTATGNNKYMNPKLNWFIFYILSTGSSVQKYFPSMFSFLIV